MSDKNARSYWQANVKIVLCLLLVWFFISFVCGILLVDFLDQFRIGGFKLGFWMAQQGSIYGFVILIYVYIWLMDRLDKRYNLDQSHSADTAHMDVEADASEGQQ